MTPNDGSVSEDSSSQAKKNQIVRMAGQDLPALTKCLHYLERGDARAEMKKG